MAVKGDVLACYSMLKLTVHSYMLNAFSPLAVSFCQFAGMCVTLCHFIAAIKQAVH